jgi:glycine/D-amino acid oxidase-like deaminating enzyme/nitrite reductase/ring-hydroxylating ferredoxin subunit
MSEHESPWLATVAAPSWATLESDLEVDFVVVGAGICGLTIASLLVADGSSVAVLEANRVGGGTTGHTTGKITSQHGLIYRELVERHGEERATAYAQANQQAIDWIEGTVKRLGVDSSFQRLPSYVYTQDPQRLGDLEAEQTAAARLGLPASLTTDTDLPFPIELAIRFDNQAMFDIGPYIVALAQEVSGDSGLIFENTRALRVSETAGAVTVHTASGQVSAGHAIVATLIPFVDRSGLFARMKPSRAYGVAAHLSEGGITGMHINADSPTRSTRPWRAGPGSGVVVVGEDHPTGRGRARPEHWGELERWARRHFNVESFEFRWSSQDYASVDRLPFVGRAPLMRRTHVATGFRKWGLTNATAAAHMIADLLAGRESDWVAAFDPTRLGDLHTLAQTTSLNLSVAKSLIKDRLQRFSAPSIDDLEVGEGSLARVNGKTVAAYRDPDGDLRCVSATCTHLGCTVSWNSAEKSWDCPCHGSRFAVDGEILNGPTTQTTRASRDRPDDLSQSHQPTTLCHEMNETGAVEYPVTASRLAYVG